MLKTKIPFYLASKSPRRRSMLSLMGIDHKVLNIEIHEEIDFSISPVKNVKKLAEDKLKAAITHVENSIILTADTIVVLDGEILGKPKSKKEAFEYLNRLSNKTHIVYTGYALKNQARNKKIIDYSKTSVTFRKLDKKEIRDYINTGSPMDKAGAYGIQDDYGAVFVKKIVGCYYNVLGFPVSKIYTSLQKII